MTSRAPTPLPDLKDEALRLLKAADQAEITLRLVGGLAVALRCPSARRPPLVRSYKDVDVVGHRSARGKIDTLVKGLGYEPEEEFNHLHGGHRLLYNDPKHRRQLDVLLDRIEMCHGLDVADRLGLDELTLAPADLLLTKLQVVEVNESDLQDVVALLADCDIDKERIADVLAADWGWWRTVTENLRKVGRYASNLTSVDQDRIMGELQALSHRIDTEPKSLRWRVRAKIGDRVRWYDLPEEDF